MQERAVNAVIAKDSAHFKAGETGQVIGIVAVKPDEKLSERICIKVKFSDGKIDYYPIDNIGITSIKLDCKTWIEAR